MSSEPSSEVKFEIGHVLFIDLVGYSKLLIEEQKKRLRCLTEIVLATPQVVASPNEQLVRLPTGDGMALVFRNSPEEPARCALEIAEALKPHPELAVRMGIHSGPVSEVTDVSGRTNIAGAGINMAQRVMDCGDAGHILLSKHVAEDLEQYGHWQPRLHDLGECEVKHGVRLGIVNLYGEGIGNSSLPNKFRILGKRRVRARWAAIAAGLILLTAVVAAFIFILRKPAQSRAAVNAPALTIPEKSIAVLPFENLSSDKNNAYFASGMQDLILTKLSDIGDLKVISRTSTEKYASHPDDLKTIARQLAVATLLEGSVQKAGNTVLIDVQLIDAPTDNHLWAQSYQRTLDNIFGVEGEVAEKIAAALKARLSPAETARIAEKPTQNATAYDLFLRAQSFTNKGGINYDTADLKAAIALYQKAVAADPEFALGWARLSHAQCLLGWFGGPDVDLSKINARARADAERALTLQPTLADARLALGSCDYYGRGNYTGALTAFTAALRARPNDVEALKASAYVLRRLGRFDEAIRQLRAALAHDPRNTSIGYELATTYAMVSRYADAQREYQLALALDPDNLNAKIGTADIIVFGSGDIERALAQVQGDQPSLELRRVLYLAYQRKYDEAIALLAGIADTPDNFNRNVSSKALLLGNLYRLSGQTGRAHPLFVQAQTELAAQLSTRARAGVPIRSSLAWSALANAELGLGHTEAALAALAKSETLLAKSADHLGGPFVMVNNATLYAEAGRADLAVPLLEQVLAASGHGASYSPLMLWLDPAWNPIRHDPGFQALLKKYAQYRPTAAGDTAPAAAATATP